MPRFIGVYRLDEPDGADRDEVVRLRRARVFLDDVRDQAHVVPHQRVFRLLIPRPGEPQAPLLFLLGQRLGKGVPAHDRTREKDDLGKHRVEKIKEHGRTPPSAAPAAPCVVSMYEKHGLYYARPPQNKIFRAKRSENPMLFGKIVL